MLSLSLSKILLTAAVIFGVLWAWRRFSGGGRTDRRAAESRAQESDAAAGPPPRPAIQDLIACPACGTYVPSEGAKPCDSKNCPY